MSTLSLDAQELLGQLWEEASSAEEKEKLRMAVDALRFIASTGQSSDFEDYRESLDANAPPLVSASFQTREEAEAWLNVAGEYHLVVYHHRILLRAIYSVSLAATSRQKSVGTPEKPPSF
jgi:hypothetical protein